MKSVDLMTRGHGNEGERMDEQHRTKFRQAKLRGKHFRGCAYAQGREKEGCMGSGLIERPAAYLTDSGSTRAITAFSTLISVWTVQVQAEERTGKV